MCSVSMLEGPCDTTDNCILGETCISGHCACGGQVLTATAVPPNMLIALDRSQSMNTTVPGTSMSRWDVATAAIKSLTTDHEATIRFGLVLWPGNSKTCTSNEHSCRGTDDAVALDFGTSMDIGDYLDSAGRCSLMTPIGNTLSVLGTYAGFADATRANFVVLVTDGDENCGGDGPAAATALRGHDPEVKTFAIGFGGEVNRTILSAIARNGGTARTGDPVYYQADDEAALTLAFTNIAGTIIGCDYTLSSIPQDPDRLFVYLGDNMLVRDTGRTNGWDYIAATQHLTFYGATCDRVKAGTEGALSVSFGCRVIP
jgi:von Willebrand factor type A domain